MKINYESNNSGGHWWLNGQDWHNLEKQGWKVEWVTNEHILAGGPDSNGQYMFLDTLAYKASKDFETPGEAMREFEKITGLSVTDEGCSCCGTPHAFRWEEGEKREYVSGKDCVGYLFDLKESEIPIDYRAAVDEIQRLKGKKK